MINAQELRIGNWIIDPDRALLDGNNGYRQITHPISSSNHEYCHHSYKHSHSGNKLSIIEPIELTPELLEKCGFKEWSTGHWKLPEEICINGWSKEFNYYEPYKVLSTYTGNVYLLHLHQLQNIFYSLTGKELEISL